MSRRLLAAAALTLACSVAGMLIALAAAGPYQKDTSLGQLEARASFSLSPGVDVYIPLADWGISFPVWKVPVSVHIEPRSLNRKAIAKVVGGDVSSLSRARRQVEEATVGALTRFLVFALLGWLGGAGFACSLLYAFRFPLAWRAAAGAMFCASVFLGFLIAWGAVSLRPAGLAEPVYYASGDELPKLLAIGQTLDRRIDNIQSRTEQTLKSVASLLDSGKTAPDGQSAIQVSDLHNNIAALRPLKGLPKQPFFWVGDFSTSGAALESPLLSGVSSIGSPAVGVSGNHDSKALMRALAAKGMMVLTHSGRLLPSGRIDGRPVIKVGKLKVAGFEDPLAAKGLSYPQVRTEMSFEDYPDGQRRQLAAERQMWRWWKSLPERPDVLLVHQDGLGRALAARIAKGASAERPLAILVGHSHRQRMDISGQITVVDSGSIGAGGILNAEPSAGLVRLHFQDSSLEAVDLISIDLESGSSKARRVSLENPGCDRQMVLCGSRAFSR